MMRRSASGATVLPPAISVWMNAGSAKAANSSSADWPAKRCGSNWAFGNTLRQPVAIERKRSEQAGIAREGGVRAGGRRRLVRVVEAGEAVLRRVAVVVVVGDARVAARGHVGVDAGQHVRRDAAALRGDGITGERIDGPAVEHGLEPARLVELLVVGQVARGDRERQPRLLAVALLDRAAAVPVDVADGRVEVLQPERLLRAPRGLQLAAGGIGEVDPRGAHLVRDLRVGELREVEQ